MISTLQNRTTQVGDTVIAATRQVWLAGLGAAVVTREWAGKEAGAVFRNLVKEGSAMETTAIRFVGNRVETSIGHANTLWKRARSTVATTVREYADSAVTLVNQTLPKSLPKVELPSMLKPAPVKRVARTAKRTVKRAAKRTTKAKRAR